MVMQENNHIINFEKYSVFTLLSVCNIFTTPLAAYHRPKLERAHKAWPNLF